MSWLLDWFAALSAKELGVAMMTIYHLWLARNDAREEPMIEDPVRLARRVLMLLEEWESLKSVGTHQGTTTMEHWLPPNQGWHKANADGALHPKEGNGGGGVIIRDHHGVSLAGECRFFPLVTDPERAELLACRHAIQLAAEKGMRRLVLETDCLNAVSKLQNKEMDRSIQGPVVEELKASFREFEAVKIVHVRHNSNRVAHGLAKFGCLNKCCNSWEVSPPDYVVSLVELDMGT